MSLPPHQRPLRDRTLADVEPPDYLWLTYAVCAVEPAACGWGGWMIEAAFKRDDQHHATGTGDRLLPAADVQRCPRCGCETYRTAATFRLEPSADQQPVHGVAGVDYEVDGEDVQ